MIKHAEKFNLNKESPSFSKLHLKDWVNKPTDEDFTAVHFASYHGNLELVVKLVEELQADFSTTNMYGANVLHVASQGD